MASQLNPATYCGRIDTFPAVAQTSPELATEVRAKFPKLFSY